MCAAVQALRHLAGGEFAKLVFAEDAFLPRNLIAETFERFGFELGCKSVHEPFESLVVFKGELAGPAGAAIRVRTDGEQGNIDDAFGTPRTSSLLACPGFVIVERIRLYENAIFINRSGANCHYPYSVSLFFLRLTFFFLETFCRGACLRFAAFFAGLGEGWSACSPVVRRRSSGAKSSTASSENTFSW